MQTTVITIRGRKGVCPPKEAPNCKGEAWHNWFAGVLNEPGPGSRSAASPLCRLLATAASAYM